MALSHLAHNPCKFSRHETQWSVTGSRPPDAADVPAILWVQHEKRDASEMIRMKVGNEYGLNGVQGNTISFQSDKRWRPTVDEKIRMFAFYMKASVKAATTSKRITTSDERKLHW